METVIIKVVTSKNRRGYELEHNQPVGFKGIIGRRWAWYKYRKDAEASAESLMTCWNN
jgi:hypothetical protein